MREPPRRRFLAVLMVLLAFNYVERHAFGLLMQSIKVDLSLSDTQLGLLTGIAFAVFYSVLGIPIARWADRGNRVTIITFAAALSGIALTLCGFAVSFVQLLLIRIGIAVGEAGHVPPAHSLLAEYFDRAIRPRAVSIYKLGIPLSAVVGWSLSGWLNEAFGWRTTLIILGTPGLLLAFLARFTLWEPRLEKRVGQPHNDLAGREATAEAGSATSFWVVTAALWKNVSFRRVLLAYAIGSFFSAGVAQWKSVFFIRSFGMGTGELGSWFALIWGVGGAVGVLLGGALATHYAARNERLQLRAMAIVYGGFGAVSAGVYASTSAGLALALMAVSVIGVSMAAGPLFSTIQSLVPDRMRAMAVAVIFLFSNLIGLGFGPLAVGVASDLLNSWAGEESLRYALLAFSPGWALTAYFLWCASNSIAMDVAAAEAEGDAEAKALSLVSLHADVAEAPEGRRVR